MSLQDLEQHSRAESFKGFRCWQTTNLNRILDREAASASRQILLATHVAPPIRKVSPQPGHFVDQGSVNQEDVLGVIASPPDESLIVPIIGASGSGKSHLVLWLRAMLDQSPDADRRIIYVPKGSTSLAGVIDLLLEGRSGGRFDELRKSVHSASTSMSERERALRFRANLAIAVEQTETSEPAHRYVADNLPALLNDATYEARLVETGGALHRIVEDALRGDSELPAEFSAADVQIDLTITEVDALGAKAKAFWTQLNRSQVLDTTVDLLNKHRDRCLSRVFGVAPMELVGVMRELRELLLQENPNQHLLLMVEDFTLLQGIQHDLLEAMIEIPRREGELLIAPMTTVMAVTDGFFSQVLASSDTLRTRIAAQGHVYSLDAEYGDEVGEAARFDPRRVREFVGRYLNAVRAGADDLEQQHPHVPNACAHCRHQAVCHDGFGSDEGDRGLYPFNALAIERVVRSRGRDFNPRDMLAVLNLTLGAHAADIEGGRFPSEQWEREFLSTEHRRELDSLSLDVERRARATDKGGQRVRLLTFWGGVPKDLGNLHPAIHEAFGVPALSEAAEVDTSASTRPPEVREPSVATSGDPVGDTLRRWRDGTERLGREDALEVRRVLGEVILGLFDGESALLSREVIDAAFKPDRDVVIERAEGGGGRRSEDRFIVDVQADLEGVFLVEGILRARDRQAPTAERVRRGDWTFDRGFEHLGTLISFADAQARRLSGHLQKRAVLERRDREAALLALYFSGLTLGIGEKGSTEGRLTAAYSTTTGPWQHAPDAWRTFAERVETQRANLRASVARFGQIRQGTGAELGLDTSDVIALVQGAGPDIALIDGPDDSAYVNLRQHPAGPAG